MAERPARASAVAHRGHMVPLPGRPGRSGYQPENQPWRDWLCERDAEGQLIGRDPLALDPAMLHDAGHPRTTCQAVVQRLRHMHGVDRGEASHDGFLGLDPKDFPRRLTAIRDLVCMACCAGNKAEIRHCAVYDCPAWAFRMGRNPHNPRRGFNPFASPKNPSVREP